MQPSLSNTLVTLDKKPNNTSEHLAFVLNVNLYNRHSLSRQMTLQ